MCYRSVACRHFAVHCGFSGHGELPGNIHIYAPAVFVPLIFTAVADKVRAKTDIADFEYIVKHPDELYSVSKIEDEGEAFEIGRGLLLGDPDIRYSAKSDSRQNLSR